MGQKWQEVGQGWLEKCPMNRKLLLNWAGVKRCFSGTTLRIQGAPMRVYHRKLERSEMACRFVAWGRRFVINVFSLLRITV
jgi:hypothetical protein